MEFLGDRGAADDAAPLQHTDFVTGPGEIERASQAVVSAPDQDGIVGMA